MNHFEAFADELRRLNLQIQQGSGSVDDAVARVAAIAQEMEKSGILTSRTLLSDSLQTPDSGGIEGDSPSKHIIQAALLTPEGFGVCHWTTEDLSACQNSSVGLETNVVRAFRPWKECLVDEKALVLPFVEEIIEDLLDNLLVHTARLDRTGSVAAQDYFSGRNSVREVGA